MNKNATRIFDRLGPEVLNRSTIACLVVDTIAAGMDVETALVEGLRVACTTIDDLTKRFVEKTINQPPTSVLIPPGAPTRWLNCPVCDGNSMPAFHDGGHGDGGWIVTCTNLACKSNYRDDEKGEPRKPTADKGDLPPCDPIMMAKGRGILVLADVPMHTIENWVHRMAHQTGYSLDWHYVGGRAVILMIGSETERRLVQSYIVGRLTDLVPHIVVEVTP